MTALELGVETAGWIGAALILLAYLLVTTGRLTGQSRLFQWMNLVGAAGFVINGWWHRAIPSTALNVIWMGIAVTALIRLSVRAQQPAKAE